MEFLKNNANILIGLGSLVVLILAYNRAKEPVQVNVRGPQSTRTIVKQFAPQVVGPGNELEVQLNYAERMAKLQSGLGLFDRILEYQLAKDQMNQTERLAKLEYDYQQQAQQRAIQADQDYLKLQYQNSPYLEAGRLM